MNVERLRSKEKEGINTPTGPGPAPGTERAETAERKKKLNAETRRTHRREARRSIMQRSDEMRIEGGRGFRRSLC